jgi:hypothetical protein
MALTFLQRVTQQAASLLNAADWKNLLRGTIGAGSGALTIADGAFTADDIGKLIYIDGAGAGGSIYDGTITAVADATHITVAPVVTTAVADATLSFGGKLQDDRRNLFELRELAFMADEAHYLPIAETKGHWLRPTLMTISGDLPHNANVGAVVPHIGPLGRVFVRVDPLGAYNPGRRAEPEEIERLRANTGIAPNNTYGSLAHNVAGSQIGGYFWMPEDENTIQVTGDSARIFHVPPYVRGTDLQTPQIYGGSMASWMVAAALAKEGAKRSEHATVHQAYTNAVIEGIRANERHIPTLEEFQSDKPPARV